MHEFQCGHEECGSRLTAPDEDSLMQQVSEHLRRTHNVDPVTNSLLDYLKMTCVTSPQP